MTAEQLFNTAFNEFSAYKSIVFAVRHLRATIDRVALKAAKANAEWHDDPADEEHAHYHAPAEEQYPREVRDEVIVDLVRHYLGELTIRSSAKGE